MRRRQLPAPQPEPLPAIAPEAAVNAVLSVALDALARGEDVEAAVAAEQARLVPPRPTLDQQAVARLTGEGWTPRL